MHGFGASRWLMYVIFVQWMLMLMVDDSDLFNAQKLRWQREGSDARS